MPNPTSFGSWTSPMRKIVSEALRHHFSGVSLIVKITLASGYKAVRSSTNNEAGKSNVHWTVLVECVRHVLGGFIPQVELLEGCCARMFLSFVKKYLACAPQIA